jgi:hypothetical protein
MLERNKSQFQQCLAPNFKNLQILLLLNLYKKHSCYYNLINLIVVLFSRRVIFFGVIFFMVTYLMIQEIK